MLIKIDPGALSRIKFHEYASRFVLGGATCVATGLIAQRFGPVIGGLFLAFPSIFPASATLVEHHEVKKKARAGIASTSRGRLSAALDARGASMGAMALIVFAVLIWKEVRDHSPVGVLAEAILAWAVIAGAIWRFRRWHTRLWIRHRAQSGLR